MTFFFLLGIIINGWLETAIQSAFYALIKSKASVRRGICEPPTLGDASPNPLFAEGSFDLKRSFVAFGETKHRRNTTFLLI